MKLSIVSTLYRSAGFVEEFYARALKAAESIADEVEFVFVNDGSPDDSVEKVLALRTRDPRITLVDLARNFGHHRAMMIGLSHASGDRVFLIDVDLEEDPAVMTRMNAVMDERGCDVVYGVQKARQRGLFDRFAGEAFYWMIGKVSRIHIPRNLTTTRIMTRQFVTELTRHQEREIVIAGLWALTGFTQVPFEVDKTDRTHKSNYSLLAKIRLFIDFLTSFSPAPLYAAFYFGAAVSVFAVLFILYLIVRFFIDPVSPPGWLSVIASVWLFGGLTIAVLGLLGIYVARIFEEVKQRPYSIIRQLHSGPDARANPERTSS